MDTERLLEEAQAEWARGAWEAAVEVLDRAIAVAPCNTTAYRLRAKAQQKRGNRAEALVDADRAIELGGPSASLLVLRARLLLGLRDLDGMLAAADEAVELAPRDPMVRAERAGFRCCAGDAAGVRADLEAIREIDSSAISYAQSIVSDALLFRERPGDAVLVLTEAIESATDRSWLAWLRTQRAEVLLDLAKLVPARNDCDCAITLAPSFSDAFRVRGLIRKQSDDLEGARAAKERAGVAGE